MIELTEQQRQELNQPEPVALDPQTREEYVLVHRAIYERIRMILDADVVATGEMADRIMAEDDLLDPYLATYQSITRESR